MHVAMVTPLPEDPTRPRGGVEAVAISLIRALLKRGISLTVVRWASSREVAYDDEDLRCRVIPLPVRHPAIIRNWLDSSRKLQRLVASLQPDVVHLQGLAELGHTLRQPRVLTIHGIAHRDEWHRGGRRRYVTAPVVAFTGWMSRKRYKHIIVISPYVREISGPMKHARLHDIENPVEDRFFEIPDGEFTPTVLVVGGLHERKNTLGVVQAAARLRERLPAARFRLAGSWETRHPAYRNSVEQFCETEGLHETVTFLGLTSRDQLMVELQRAACLFLPSFQETAPTTISEALAAGVPVAASRVCGIPWMVDEGRTGLLFEPRDQSQMVECLYRLLVKPDLRERMRRACREEAKGRFRAEAVAERTVAVYQQAVESHHVS